MIVSDLAVMSLTLFAVGLSVGLLVGCGYMKWTVHYERDMSKNSHDAKQARLTTAVGLFVRFSLVGR